ncbi:hypothetical protein ACEQ8H_004105 [Pleosporales sp. CAS-2024a]
MAPGVLSSPHNSLRRSSLSSRRDKIATKIKNCLLNRNMNVEMPRIAIGEGNWWVNEEGDRIYDASTGAAVACMGKYNERVLQATLKVQKAGLSYLPSSAFVTKVVEDLAHWVIKSTDYQMELVAFYSGGSEAVEAALKMAVQYHQDKSPSESRSLFIARDQSYHGNTMGALDASGHEARKALYHGVLPQNMHTIPPCNVYRNRAPGQSDGEYLEWHKTNLANKIEELGPENVAAFIMEPVVGAALGCAAAVPGYMKAMREVCDKYGVLLIFDEVMCGMGRTGRVHAWQVENVAPDIQTIGKGLAGGFEVISGTLIAPKVAKVIREGPRNGSFIHGHTFQNQPKPAAAALELQMIIEEGDVLRNVREKGLDLETKLRARLGDHRYVGDIRGPREGLFYAIEFVSDKATKTPFPREEEINAKIFELGLTKGYGIHVYPGAGSADGRLGDHVIIAPAYNITTAEVDLIVDRISRVIEDFFNQYEQQHGGQ